MADAVFFGVFFACFFFLLFLFLFLLLIVTHLRRSEHEKLYEYRVFIFDDERCAIEG